MPASFRITLAIAGGVIVMAIAAFIAWAFYARQYYPVETYRARIAVEGSNLRLLADGEDLPPMLPVTRADGTISLWRVPIIESTIVIERAIPMKHGGRRRGTRAWDPERLPPPAETIANAGPEFNIRVQLLQSGVDDPSGQMLTFHHQLMWPPEYAEQEDERMSRLGVPYHLKIMPEERATRALDLVAQDFVKQSGHVEYAEFVRRGGVKGPGLPTPTMELIATALLVVAGGSALVILRAKLARLSRERRSAARR